MMAKVQGPSGTAHNNRERVRNGAASLGACDDSEAHKVTNRFFVGALGVGVGQIGEPFELGRDFGQPMKLGGGRSSPSAGTIWFGNETSDTGIFY
jgi:hypothetical protein